MDFIYLNRPDGQVTMKLFSDLERCNNVKFLPVYKKWNFCSKSFCSLYTYGDWYSKFFCFVKPYCDNNYSLNIKDDNNPIVIIFNSALAFLAPYYLKQLGKKFKLVLVMVDSISNRVKCETDKIKFFGNNVFTFDPEDAKKYGFSFTLSYYSKLTLPPPIHTGQGPSIYCGARKDRLNTLHDAYNYLTSQTIPCKFNILSVPQNEQKIHSVNYLEDSISYIEYLNQMNACTCIFDVTQKKQTGITLRYFEAVCYNKKLVTDNPLVKNLPFYNPDYMQVYDKVENIDTDWIKRDIKVDYGYDGRFSPIHFLEELEKHFSTGEEKK